MIKHWFCFEPNQKSYKILKRPDLLDCLIYYKSC